MRVSCLPVASAVNIFGIFKGLVVVEPIVDVVIFVLVQFHLDWFKGLHCEHVVSVIERGLFVIKCWEFHALEVSTISFLTTHHDPHGAPLCDVDWLNHFWHLVDYSEGSSDMVECADVSHLLPGHGHIF